MGYRQNLEIISFIGESKPRIMSSFDFWSDNEFIQTD